MHPDFEKVVKKIGSNSTENKEIVVVYIFLK